MPYIQIRTNSKVTDDEEKRLKEKLGSIIGTLGKSESWLMLEFVPECKLYFQGNNESLIAYIDVKIYGRSNAENYNKMTDQLCSLFNDELKIPKNNIYISYSEFENWGWNGSNF